MSVNREDGEIDVLERRVQGVELPEPPCEAPGSPLERAAYIYQNEGLTLYGELMLLELLRDAEGS